MARALFWKRQYSLDKKFPSRYSLNPVQHFVLCSVSRYPSQTQDLVAALERYDLDALIVIRNHLWDPLALSLQNYSSLVKIGIWTLNIVECSTMVAEKGLQVFEQGV